MPQQHAIPHDAPRFELAPDDLFETARAAVTERIGGVSTAPFESLNLGRSVPDDPERVRRNEERALAALRLDDRVARLRLEHGARILTVQEPGMYGPADGVLTRDATLLLWLTVADCYPAAYECGPFRALGHCGWRGVAAGLPERLLEAIHEASGHPRSDVRVWVGPGIGACCYEVGPDVTQHFPASALKASQHLHARDGHLQLDLRGEISRRLVQGGLPLANLRVSPACTSCEPERFFSHRRDGYPSGRMAALSWSRGHSASQTSR